MAGLSPDEKRQFSLADYVQVKGATFDNGLLKIELGAFAAAAAAWEGGGVRDGTWGRVNMRETLARSR